MTFDSTFDLPSGWSAAHLGDIVPKARPKIPADPTSSLPFVGMDHIEPHTFHLVGRDEFAKMKSAGSYFREGDVLYGRLRPYLNKVHRAKFEGVASAEFIVLPASEIYDSDFLKYMLHQRCFIDFAMSCSSGDRPRVKFDGIAEFEFGLPPLPEQQRIVEKIESLFAQLDKGEAALREVQTLLTRYRQSVLKSAVTGQLTADWRAQRESQSEDGGDLLARILKTRREGWSGRGRYKEPVPPDTSGLPELPEDWVWASVDQLSRILGGLTKNSKRQELPLRRPMLRVANVYQNRLALDDVHQTGITVGELARVTLEAKDILVVEGNGSRDQIGRMAVWSGEIPDAVHQNHIIKVRLYEQNLAEFFVTWFQSLLGRQVVEAVASSTSGLYTLSISKIASMVIPLPSLEEAAEIMGIVEEAHSQIATLETWCATELKRSASLRQSILKEAFAGKLVAQDPNDEPASALLARIAAKQATAKKPRRRTPA